MFTNVTLIMLNQDKWRERNSLAARKTTRKDQAEKLFSFSWLFGVCMYTESPFISLPELFSTSLTGLPVAPGPLRTHACVHT